MKRFFKPVNILIGTALLFIGLLGGEVYWWSQSDQDDCLVLSIIKADEMLGWVYKPNAKTSLECDSAVVINKQGRLGSLLKEDQAQKVLLVGDALMAGLENPWSETVSQILESNLGGQDKPAAVIHEMVPGYGSDQVYLKIKQAIQTYQPDSVVYFFSPDDVIDNHQNWFAKQYLFKKRYFHKHSQGIELATQPKLMLPESKVGWLKRLKTYQLIDRMVHWNHKEKLPVYYQKNYHKLWDLTERILVRINQLVKDHQVKFILVSVPLKEQVDTKYAKKYLKNFQLAANDGFATINLFHKKSYDLQLPQIVLRETSRRHGITYYDPYPYFAQRLKREKQTFWHDSNHLNPLGHRVMADYLIDVVFAEH